MEDRRYNYGRYKASGRNSDVGVRRAAANRGRQSFGVRRNLGRTSGSASARKGSRSLNGGLGTFIRDSVTRGSIDYMFLSVVILLVTFGLVMLFSASSGTSYTTFGNSYKYVISQGKAVALGAVLMYAASVFDYHAYSGRIAVAAYVVVAVLLVAVLVAGTEVKGAKRWIGGFQPSEAAKAVLTVVLAYTLSRPQKQKDLKLCGRGLKNYLQSLITGVVIPHGALIFIYVALLALEPHFSCILLICGVSAIMLFVAGLPGRHIAVVGLTGGAALMTYGLSAPYRVARWVSFANPFADMRGSGYQIVQSLYAIGSGGIFGVGLGKSRQKFMSLPEPHNDFIFSVLCEELGLVGAIVLIGMFVFLLWRGLKIAKNAPDLYGCLLVVGLVMQIILQAAANIAVVTASMPVTGIPLPFFSYGGTAICITMAEMGIVLNVSRQSKMML